MNYFLLLRKIIFWTAKPKPKTRDKFYINFINGICQVSTHLCTFNVFNITYSHVWDLCEHMGVRKLFGNQLIPISRLIDLLETIFIFEVQIATYVEFVRTGDGGLKYWVIRYYRSLQWEYSANTVMHCRNSELKSIYWNMWYLAAWGGILFIVLKCQNDLLTRDNQSSIIFDVATWYVPWV